MTEFRKAEVAYIEGKDGTLMLVRTFEPRKLIAYPVKHKHHAV